MVEPTCHLTVIALLGPILLSCCEAVTLTLHARVIYFQHCFLAVWLVTVGLQLNFDNEYD